MQSFQPDPSPIIQWCALRRNLFAQSTPFQLQQLQQTQAQLNQQYQTLWEPLKDKPLDAISKAQLNPVETAKTQLDKITKEVGSLTDGLSLLDEYLLWAFLPTQDPHARSLQDAFLATLTPEQWNTLNTNFEHWFATNTPFPTDQTRLKEFSSYTALIETLLNPCFLKTYSTLTDVRDLVWVFDQWSSSLSQTRAQSPLERPKAASFCSLIGIAQQQLKPIFQNIADTLGDSDLTVDSLNELFFDAFKPFSANPPKQVSWRNKQFLVPKANVDAFASKFSDILSSIPYPALRAQLLPYRTTFEELQEAFSLSFDAVMHDWEQYENTNLTHLPDYPQWSSDRSLTDRLTRTAILTNFTQRFEQFCGTPAPLLQPPQKSPSAINFARKANTEPETEEALLNHLFGKPPNQHTQKTSDSAPLPPPVSFIASGAPSLQPFFDSDQLVPTITSNSYHYNQYPELQKILAMPSYQAVQNRFNDLSQTASSFLSFFPTQFTAQFDALPLDSLAQRYITLSKSTHNVIETLLSEQSRHSSLETFLNQKNKSHYHQHYTTDCLHTYLDAPISTQKHAFELLERQQHEDAKQLLFPDINKHSNRQAPALHRLDKAKKESLYLRDNLLHFSAFQFKQTLSDQYRGFIATHIERDAHDFAQRLVSECSMNTLRNHFFVAAEKASTPMPKGYDVFRQGPLFEALETHLNTHLEQFFQDPETHAFPLTAFEIWCEQWPQLPKAPKTNPCDRLIARPALAQALILSPILYLDHTQAYALSASMVPYLHAALSTVPTGAALAPLSLSLRRFQHAHQKTIASLCTQAHPRHLESRGYDRIKMDQAFIGAIEANTHLGGSLEVHSFLLGPKNSTVQRAFKKYWDASGAIHTAVKQGFACLSLAFWEKNLHSKEAFSNLDADLFQVERDRSLLAQNILSSFENLNTDSDIPRPAARRARL